jgi:ABC-type dipeptide/oligopeptide/nickel transport system permease subunit
MLSDAVDALIANNWWLVLPPAMAYAVLQVSVNFVADALAAAQETPGGGN